MRKQEGLTARGKLVILIDDGGFEWEDVHSALDAIEAEAEARALARAAAQVEALKSPFVDALHSAAYYSATEDVKALLIANPDSTGARKA